MLEKFKKLDWVYILLLVLGARAVVDASFAQAAFMLIICSFKGFQLWLDSKKEVPVSEELKRDLNEVKSALTGLSLKGTKPQAPTIDSRRFF